MKTFPLKIATPDGDVYAAPAVRIMLRGCEGELAVLAGHTPFVTAVLPCDCRVETEEEVVRTGHTEGGILTVGTDSVTLLCGSFLWL